MKVLFFVLCLLSWGYCQEPLEEQLISVTEELDKAETIWKADLQKKEDALEECKEYYGSREDYRGQLGCMRDINKQYSNIIQQYPFDLNALREKKRILQEKFDEEKKIQDKKMRQRAREEREKQDQEYEKQKEQEESKSKSKSEAGCLLLETEINKYRKSKKKGQESKYISLYEKYMDKCR